MSAICLNCETTLQGSYCHKCGQKASTHRITFSKFIYHDLIHGIFHLDKGILHTLRSLLYNPGYTARKYIKGERVKHYNIFALFLIVIALKSLLDHINSPGEIFRSESLKNRHSDDLINETFAHYYKLLYLLVIPLLSAFSFMLLKRLKYNFVEHIVLNSFILTGGFFYALILATVQYLTPLKNLDNIAFVLILVYIMLAYYQVTFSLYSFWHYLWRSLLIVVLFLMALIVILFLLIVIFYQGGFQGHVQF